MIRAFTCLLPIVLLLAIAGCRYEIPLVTRSETSIDRQVLGTWERLDSEKEERVQVIRFSDQEYLLNYYVDDDVLYLRTYPIEFEGREYVQMEFIGTNAEVINEEKRKFDVIRFDLNGESAKTMTVWWLNTEIVSIDITTSPQLKETIRQNLGAEDLFKKYGEFVKLDSNAPG